MNIHLQHILDTLLQIEAITDEQRSSLNKTLKEADKELTILEFKLDRTEKVKRTTAILLEETIEELELKRKAIEETNSALQRSLEDLKATQSQLIQQEKLASLGQLTAGIAHEIQNPLNFVNNFSEVNNELIDEQLEEIEKGDLEEIKELALIMKENSEKITLHGKRADAIVKGMLEHSKTGSGKKEPTNLNALAEEFSRLAFNSFLAKNKDFKGEYKLELDPELPLLEVVPQDIGKVLLNLLNNAFYACAEQRKDLSGFENLTGLTPTVTVSTKNLGDKIQISVKDNGPGIPEAIKDKIFQPFFTTKPTGQGTGLGLSLSYDIIKAHGGEIHVESKPGKLTTFEILLLM
ncbi:His Kinase A (phospho-acceptor) domain-containing protein [Algoriphagus alkaliphilus]|uniref:histidine kinase n=1 Tax=Algoriphagus alkaliphilus TaxID=279824 RepID=A0A1G5YYB6_9BACT|nr:ATP-binding protein [Algoriphagus alkaliphilus]SDA87486.1 His Kinase A (phospho-acceptor) domain-containing protein [Algoriphagus alkaliphilus]